MSKKYIGTAKKIAEINVNIVAENEEEAMTILDKFVSNFDLFSSTKNQIIDLEIEEKGQEINEEKYKHSDIYEINSCEKCECFCPVCHSCMIDE